MSKRIDPRTLPVQTGTMYPPPYDQPCLARERRRLGDAAGLTQYGVNLLRLKPGVWSSQRHAHMTQDEFVYVLEGEVVLVTNAGEEILKAGDCAGSSAARMTAIICRTAATPTPCCWKPAPATIPTASSIPASTWSIRPAASPRCTPTLTARPTPTSGGARLAKTDEERLAPRYGLALAL